MDCIMTLQNALYKVENSKAVSGTTRTIEFQSYTITYFLT